MEPVSILGISGSLRKASFNSALLRVFGEEAPAGVSFSIFDAVDVPVFNADLEAFGEPAPVAALQSAIEDADAVLFATPEYNGGIPGSMKNIIDWASRGGFPIKGKPCAVIGGGGRFGTAHAQLMLKHILLYMGCPVMPGQSLYVQRISGAFDESGKLTDERTRERLARLGVAMAAWVAQTKAPAD